MSVHGPDVDLANRLRRWLNPIGVQVVEIDGWQSRGRDYATFNPYGSVNHHTAGPRLGIAPSLGICINGRAGLPGPLCHVHQQRNDVVNVVAAGVANHAGRGGWQALSGNQSVFGLEVEHCGYEDEPFPERRLDISCRVHAAFLSGLDRPDAVMNCQHFEWSTEGKIDFCKPLLPGGAAGFRFRVQQLLANGPGAAPAPEPVKDVHSMLGQCIDDGRIKGKSNVAPRKWWFGVGLDNDVWASVDNGGMFVLIPRGTDGKPKSAFHPGLTAIFNPADGKICVGGVGLDNQGWQIVFTPGTTPIDTWIGVVDGHPHAFKA